MSATTENLLDEYARYFSAAHVRSLASQGHDIVEGERQGSYLYDTAGRRYLDCSCSAGTYNLGRNNRELAEAFKAAIPEADQGNFPMISKEKAALARALSDFAVGDLDCAVFGVVRGEAMEFACKVARGFTGRSSLVTVAGGWYGETGFAMTLSERDDKVRYGPLIPDVRVVPFGDLGKARAVVGAQTAAVVLEPLQAENHCREASADYLRGLQELCRRAGALLIVDETQTGLGRAGEKLLSLAAGIQPDLLVLGEALGGGLFPMTATLLTQRVNTFMNDHPMIHLSTFGGSDLGCRVAVKALELYRRERPWENARRAGQQLLDGIEALAERHPQRLRSVAGRGLLVSIDAGSRTAALALCRSLARQRVGVLASPGRVAKHTVLLRPSLLISPDEVDELLTALEAVASEGADRQ